MQQFDFSQLSVGERIGLAQSLLNSVQEEIDEPQINLAWRNEIENRAAGLASGEVKTIPWEDVKNSLFAGI